MYVKIGQKGGGVSRHNVIGKGMPKHCVACLQGTDVSTALCFLRLLPHRTHGPKVRVQSRFESPCVAGVEAPIEPSTLKQAKTRRLALVHGRFETISVPGVPPTS